MNTSKKQTMVVQVLAFFTAALSVIFLKQYYQSKAAQRFPQSPDNSLVTHPKILLECSEVPLSEEITVTPITH